MQTVGLEAIAEGDDDPGQLRQGLIHMFELRHHLGHHVGHQQHDHSGSDGGQGGGVDQRDLDFAADLLLAFAVFSQPQQYLSQTAGLLPGGNHGAV